jgi:integrase
MKTERIPTEDEVFRIAGHMRDPAGEAAVMVAAYSGLRISEIIDLRGDDVKAKPGRATYLRVRHGKGERERTSVLLEPAATMLENLGYTDLRYVFKHCCRHCIGEGCRACDYTPGKAYRYDRFKLSKEFAAAQDRGSLEERYRFHVLRKFHATQLLNAGVSEMDAAFQLGHLHKDGRPNTEMIRKVYGYPEASFSLDRVAQVMSTKEG